MQINGFVWDDTVSTADDAKVNDPRNPLLVLLAVLLFAECALLVAATVYLVVELLIATPASLASALFLTVLTGIAAAWLGVIAQSVDRDDPEPGGGNAGEHRQEERAG